MKTTHVLMTAVIFAASFLSNSASAKIWRVNNNSNYNGTTLWGDNFGGTSNYPVFDQLQNANNSNFVTSGDTLYIEGSNANYDGVNLNKRLVIIGPGYFLTENPKVSNDMLQASVYNINFYEGSEGSQLIGVYVYSGYGIDIGVSNVVIKRCKIDYDVYVSENITDISILQNFFTNANNNTASAVGVSAYGFPANFVFNNNISKRTLILVRGSSVYTATECKNNVFDCPAINGSPSIQLNVGSFQNNILKTSTATVSINGGSNQNVSYNISASATGQFGTGNNNKVVTNMSSLFVSSGTSDGQYKLKPNSPGSDNGSDGTDRGAFGGAAVINRYTLSGLAPIPVIYALNTSAVATQQSGLSVTISARTIK